METETKTVIELGRIKIVAIILGSLVASASGLWMAMMDAETLLKNAPFGGRVFPFNSPVAMHWIGVAGVVFFGACCLFGLYKLFDREPGLILDADGFTDNASAVAAGFVPWTDVTDVQTHRIAQQPMLIVVVADPQRYMRKQNLLQQIATRTSLATFGSPIGISASALKIGFDELSNLFRSYWTRYGNPPPEAPSPAPAAASAWAGRPPG
jgi:hypothetical protein